MERSDAIVLNEPSVWHRVGRALAGVSVGLYLPFGWLLVTSVHERDHSLQWIKLWPILPGVLAGSLPVPPLNGGRVRRDGCDDARAAGQPGLARVVEPAAAPGGARGRLARLNSVVGRRLPLFSVLIDHERSSRTGASAPPAGDFRKSPLDVVKHDPCSRAAARLAPAGVAVGLYPSVGDLAALQPRP